MYSHDFEGCGEIILMVIVIIVLCIGSVWMLQAECTNKTADIGYASRWMLIGGCHIEVEEGRWIPLESWYFRP